MKKHLLLKDYIQLLEQKGYFLLGEPMVRYKITSEQEQIAFFLTYDQANIHTVLVEAELVEDTRKLNRVFALTMQTVPSYQIFSLKHFVNLYGDRLVDEKNVEHIKTTKSYINSSTILKDSAVHILKTETLKNNEQATLNQSLKNLNYLLGTVNSFVKAEQILYLSKVHNLNNGELKELTELPLSWLVDTIPVNPAYNSITLPHMNQKLMANRQVYPI